MVDRPTSAAQSLYPHLKSGTPERQPERRAAQSVAEAMYPRPQPQPPAPQRQTHDWRDWSGVDPNWARLVGLVRR
jgi:hypothetical protein